MNDWTSGYVADIDYVFGYYQELNPLRIQFALLYNGLEAPNITTACELGFGQGVTVNFHAAGSLVSWHGTDFNPTQAGYAQTMANASGCGADLRDASFAEYCARTDLPDFDYIALHGIWSWISDENRSVITDFIRRKLKVGGAVYVSYNTLPGWSGFAPIRQLMMQHAQTMSASGAGLVNRIRDAVEFAERLLETQPALANAFPGIGERMKKLRDQNPRYLAHEFFNQDWHPMYFARMAEWMAPAKLKFACSANLPDAVDGLNLTPEQVKFLADIRDPVFRESVRDCMVNQQFRRDIWVKGPRRLSAIDRLEALLELPFVLKVNREDVILEITGTLKKADMNPDMYNPILDVLSDNRPHRLADLQTGLARQFPDPKALLQAILVLMSSGQVTVANSPEVTQAVRVRTDRLNTALMDRARGSNEIGSLASPVTGDAVGVSRFHQLFILASQQGRETPAAWAEFAWKLMQIQGERLVIDGKPLADADANLAELQKQAEVFAARRIPVLKALQVI